jgi:hypothetical protein
MNRFDYIGYDKTSIIQQARFKDEFIKLELYINEFEDSRSKKLALEKLEECYMWIGKTIRDEQGIRNGITVLQEESNKSW